MAQSFDLTQLDSASFENMVNFLALKVLGSGNTGFAPGPDGGRDGYFKGEAPYPSIEEKWSGEWYIQSKFHKPSLSKNANSWLVSQVQKEIDLYIDTGTLRKIPDIWIIATNIDPSGVSETGSYDKIKKLIRKNLGPKIKFDIWGGSKILALLAEHPTVSEYYGHFLTPGHILTSLQRTLVDSSAQVEAIISHFIISNFSEQIYTKLEQAGSNSDTRPKIHDLFIDLPFSSVESGEGLIFETLISSAANAHRISVWNDFGTMWQAWARTPKRSRVTVIKGGPGQGKSTIGQYFAQIQRAALILADGPPVTPSVRAICRDLRDRAIQNNYWPAVPRIPITIELKDFAKWYGSQAEGDPVGVLTYLSMRIKSKIGEDVLIGTFKRALKQASWFITFDGLDEVPNDVKDNVANEIIEFTDELIPEIDADVLILCTTRPQGYSGQFERLDTATVILSSLPPATALSCAAAVVSFGRSSEESESSIAILENALASEQVRELMTTPLQSHIMAVLVRDGGCPPEKRWQLFENFYQVMKKREMLKGFGDPNVAKLLRDSDTLLRAIHSRLGISLHAQAENSSGAETTLAREDFKNLAVKTTKMLIVENVSGIVDALMEATTERLVFVNTPDDNQSVRFDIRQLQEFFAGEFIYTDVNLDELQNRIQIIGSDSHWREVMHFMLSALVVANRSIELIVAIEAVSNLDINTECQDLRILKHRMAAGAILTLRLLNEGVLEQDRRVRDQFLNALKPIFASLNSNILDILTSVNHPNSQAWLLGVMADALDELSEPEQIAAAVVLSRNLPISHPRTAKVKEKVFNSSTPYLTFLIEINTLANKFSFNNAEDQGLPITDWFLTGLLQLVVDWRTPSSNHDDIDLEKVFEALRGFSNRTTRLIHEFPSNIQPYLMAFILNNDPSIKEESLERPKRAGLACVPYRSAWADFRLPPLLNFDHNQPSSNPLFVTLDALIDFTLNKDHASYLRLIAKLLDSKISPDVLPPYMLALIPMNLTTSNYTDELQKHFTISPQEFESLIQNRIFRGTKIIERSKLYALADFDLAAWREAFGKLPDIALTLWFSHHAYVDQKDLTSTDEYTDEVRKLAIGSPAYFSKHVLAWGKLLSIYPDDRNQILASLKSVPYHAKSEVINGFTIYPFKINLPDEMDFLIPFAQAVVDMEKASSKSNARRFRQDSNRPLNAETLLQFGISISTLTSIFNNEALDLSHRRAALSIYLCHEFTNSQSIKPIPPEHIYEIFQSLLTDSPEWYILSGLVFCEKNVPAIDLAASKFIGGLLRRFRENYQISEVIQQVVVNWRERSSAPVNRHSALDPWLSYNAT